MAQEINSQNFEALIASGQPVVVDFWATWCGPCQMVGPFIEELAHEYEGRVVVGKCDVEQGSPQGCYRRASLSRFLPL